MIMQGWWDRSTWADINSQNISQNLLKLVGVCRISRSVGWTERPTYATHPGVDMSHARQRNACRNQAAVSTVHARYSQLTRRRLSHRLHERIPARWLDLYYHMKPRRLGPFLTVEEVAEILRTTPQALYMMRHRGQGPPSVKVGRKLLYAQSDVETYIDHLYSQQEIATEPFRVTIGGSA